MLFVEYAILWRKQKKKRRKLPWTKSNGLMVSPTENDFMTSLGEFLASFLYDNFEIVDLHKFIDAVTKMC